MKTRIAIAAACCALMNLSAGAAWGADKKPTKATRKAIASPAQQCLDSFKDKLKDPESGRVINFTDPMLVYTATNDFGGRVQGKALCKEVDGKWTRDRETELEQAVKLAHDTAVANLECAKSGKRQCDDGPQSLPEAIKALGFN